jgi:Periplasmic lysozyme inhibitor of I-type lysozyme
MDDFVFGVVRPRNGIVEAVRFDDIDDDDKPEIIVIIRSVGSGGYLSADAFSYRARSLEWVVSVAALDKAADPIRALRDKFKVLTETKG